MGGRQRQDRERQERERQAQQLQDRRFGGGGRRGEGAEGKHQGQARGRRKGGGTGEEGGRSRDREEGEGAAERGRAGLLHSPDCFISCLFPAPHFLPSPSCLSHGPLPRLQSKLEEEREVYERKLAYEIERTNIAEQALSKAKAKFGRKLWDLEEGRVQEVQKALAEREVHAREVEANNLFGIGSCGPGKGGVGLGGGVGAGKGGEGKGRAEDAGGEAVECTGSGGK